MFGIISYLERLFGAQEPSDNGPQRYGPDAAATARRELEGGDGPLDGTVGRPEVVDYSGEFSTDIKVELPIHTPRYADPAPLTYDVDGDAIDGLLDSVGLDSLDDIATLEGASVTVTWDDGEPTVALDGTIET